MKTLSLLLLLALCACSTFGQIRFQVPVSNGAKFEKGFYDQPVEVIAQGYWNASENQKENLKNVIKQMGFESEIILITPPEYPKSAFHDSVKNVCNVANVKTQMLIKFYTTVYNDNFIFESEMNTITIEYGMYNPETGKSSSPKTNMAASSFKKLTKLLHKRVPLNK